MKTRTLWMLGWLLPAVLVACATNQSKAPATAGKVTPQMRSGSNELRTYQLLEWIAPDDHNLIKEVQMLTFDGEKWLPLKRAN